MPILDFFHPGLQLTHSPHLANLFEGQGHGHQSHQNGEHDNGDTHVVETKHI